MTTISDPEEPHTADAAVDTDTDTAADELPDGATEPAAGPVVTNNYGQSANHVDRMTQNNYWVNRYRAAFELTRDFVRLTMETFVEREYQRVGTASGPMDSVATARLNPPLPDRSRVSRR